MDEARQEAEPFKSPAHAWFWCWRLLQARADGRAPRADMREGGARPCTPDDILRVLDALHRRGRITLEHVRVLREYGEKGRPPNPVIPGEHTAFVHWQQAMSAMGVVLEAKGIVMPRKERGR